MGVGPSLRLHVLFSVGDIARAEILLSRVLNHSGGASSRTPLDPVHYLSTLLAAKISSYLQNADRISG